MARRSSTFTTYLGVEEAKNVDPTFAALERKANNTFNRIAQTAARASAASGGIGTSRTSGLASNVGRTQASAAAAERAQAQALQRTAQAARIAEAAEQRLAGRRIVATATTRATAHANSQLETSLRRVSLAASIAQGPLGPLAGRLQAATYAARDLSGASLGLVGAAAGIAAYVRVASTVQDLKGQLRPLYDTQIEVNRAFAESRKIADDARVGLEPVISLYSRLTLAGRDAGLSQQRIAKLTEIASKAARLSGGPSASQQAGLYQFSQGIGSGTLGGDELKSVRENTLRLSKALSDGLGVPMAKLKELGAEGKLTPKVIADALEKEADRIDAELAHLPNTISSATSKLDNAFKAMIDGTEESFGTTTVLANGMVLLADNLGVASRAILGFGVAWASIKTANLVAQSYQRIQTTKAEGAAALATAQQQKTASATARRASVDRVVALRAERAALQARAEAERQVANETRRAALDVGKRIQGGDYAVNNPREVQGYAKAVDAARVAQDNYGASKKRLKSITSELRTETGRLSVATNDYRSASQAASAASGGFGAALRSVFNATTLLNIALGFGITMLLQYLSNSSEAKQSADRLANSQERLAQYFDFATGKIREQNVALLENARRQSRNDIQEAKAAAIFARASASNVNVLSNDPAIRSIQDQYRTGKIFGPTASQRLAQLRKSRPDLSSQIDPVINYIGKATEKAREALTLEAGDRLLNRTGNANDIKLAQGDFSGISRAPAGGPAATPRTRQQIEAAAAQEAASTGLQKARADLKALRAQMDPKTGLLPGKDEVQTQHDLAAAMRQVTSAQEAQTAARKSASAGAAAARKEARDAIQDQKDLALAKLNADKIDLEKRKPSLTQGEYNAELVRINALYDDRVNALDASAAASNRATAVELANIKKLQEAAAAAKEKRTDILASYDSEPKALDKARDNARVLQSFVGQAMDGLRQISDDNPLGTGVYTQEMADADKARIEYGVRQPIRDALQEQQRGIDLSKLRLEGYDMEADALERALSIQDSMGEVSRDELESLVRNEQQQLRINDALASRQRQTQQILDLAQQTRDTFEDMLVGLAKDPAKAIKNAFNSTMENILRIRARQITEKIFAGADEKLRDLISGSNGVDRAAELLKKNIKTAADSTAPVITANERLANSTNALADRFDSVFGTGQITPTATPTDKVVEAVKDSSAGVGKVAAALAGAVGGSTAATVVSAAAGGALGALGVGGQASQSDGDIGADALPGGSNEIVVIGQRAGKIQVSQDGGAMPGSSQALSKSFEGLGSTLDKTFKSGTFFSGIGKGVGKAFGGAATGTATAGLMKSLGIKTSKTGAQIGGALGSLTGIPGMDIVGSIAGGLIGGLFKKTKKGSSSVSVNAYGEAVAGTAVGNSGSYKKAAEGLAGSVSDQLNAISEQLGADLGTFSVSIGQRKKKFVVDPTGQNRTKGAGVVKFKDEQEAIEYALRDALADGALKGISEASQRILKSGQDLTRALNKALAIESIPKRLLALTDPVASAVTTLNDEFENLIGYLKEGGATAAQFAEAQKLYDLERASAIEQATKQSVAALQAYMDEMTGGASSPFNKKTVYDNASSALTTYRDQIAAGKTVDQEDFLTAVKNFQEASRNRYGSGQEFFNDFQDIYDLVSQAKMNATGTGSTTVPSSPFDTTEVQNLLKGQTQATTDQTVALGTKLDGIAALLANLGVSNAAYLRGAISALPGF